jgi:hypothetical protein
LFNERDEVYDRYWVDRVSDRLHSDLMCPW